MSPLVAAQAHQSDHSVTSLAMPVMSAYDPPMADEGRLDPLGLATLADRLADSIAPQLRARMQRIRFLSVIALGALVTGDLADVTPADNADTPQLAFERLVVEALARTSTASDPIPAGVPGITKAHSARLKNTRLSSTSYLKAPRVFGFHGIYRPLATGLGIIDSAGGLLQAGHELLRAVERDLPAVAGLSRLTPGSPGASIASWLAKETADAYRTGANTFPTSSANPNVRLVSALARPAPIRGWERRALGVALQNPRESAHPADDASYIELATLIRTLNFALPPGEKAATAELLNHAGASLRLRLKSINAYENFARDLTWAFGTYRWLSTTGSPSIPTARIIDNATGITTPAKRLHRRYETALHAMDRAADADSRGGADAIFAHTFAAFAEPLTPAELVDRLITHHNSVQDLKMPSGKRSWFDHYGAGWRVRPIGSVHDRPDQATAFLHPYRITALRSFFGDLDG